MDQARTLREIMESNREDKLESNTDQATAFLAVIPAGVSLAVERRFVIHLETGLRHLGPRWLIGREINDALPGRVGLRTLTLVLMAPETAGVIHAYGALKRLHTEKRTSEVGVVVNGLAKSREVSQSIKKTRALADRFLGIKLRFIGYYIDGLLNDSRYAQSRNLVESDTGGSFEKSGLKAIAEQIEYWRKGRGYESLSES